MRRIVLVLALVFAAAGAAVVAVTFKEYREHLQIQARHDEVVRLIVEAAQELPDTDIARAIEVRFGAKDVRLQPLLMVSDPPKLELTFMLDGVRHTSIVTPKFPPAQPKRVDGK